MANNYPNGGTNSSEQDYTTSSNVGGANSTLTNTAAGTLAFVSPAGTVNNLYGNLVNSGKVTFKPSTAGAGSSAYLGASGNALTQTGGVLSFSQLNGTSGSSVYLQYGAISNDATSTITLESAAASTMSAPYVTNLTNAGTIKVVDTGGTGMTSNWGNGGGTFDNSGNFSIDDSKAASGSTTNFNFKQIVNQTSGTFSVAIPEYSTAIFLVGRDGFVNDGVWSITSSASGIGNIQFLGAGSSGYTNNGTINATNTSLTFDQALKGVNGSVNLARGANVTLTGSKSGVGQTFEFSGGNNTLSLVDGKTFGGVIRGFSQGDTLNLNVNGTPSYDPTTGILTIRNGSNTFTYDVGKGYTGTFSDNGGTVTYVGATPCYLPGSMIRTPSGDQAVETLAIGDKVMVWDPASESEKVEVIIWVGTCKILAQPHLADDLANYPVRILKDALSDGVPYKDMLITSEHCLFFEGKLIPARMLVNGCSIFYDRDLTAFDVYHVETLQHSVLIADGVLAESFLNTENHKTFRLNGMSVSPYTARALRWEEHAAAPLAVDRASVEPIFRQIESRAGLVGYTSQTSNSIIIDDPDLRLQTEAGVILRASRKVDGCAVFMLPTGVETVHILSNSSRPCDVIGPFVDDRRELGVLVGSVTIFESGQTREVTSHLQKGNLGGWHGVEDAAVRWTTSRAILSLGHRPPDSIATLSVEILAAGPYILNDAETAQVTLSA